MFFFIVSALLCIIANGSNIILYSEVVEPTCIPVRRSRHWQQEQSSSEATLGDREFLLTNKKGVSKLKTRGGEDRV